MILRPPSSTRPDTRFPYSPLYLSPQATSRILSKISWPTCTTVFSPSAMPPQLMSMSSAMRLYMAVLVASLMDGEGLKPNTEPRPVVKQTRLAPEATCPVTEQGRSEGHTSDGQSLMRNSYAVLCLK